jgi:hypothetical protein
MVTAITRSTVRFCSCSGPTIGLELVIENPVEHSWKVEGRTVCVLPEVARDEGYFKRSVEL